ncbi:type II toxin-antitoxin system Phd/YefM family antitoxin [Endozoicomonas numazuensis]
MNGVCRVLTLVKPVSYLKKNTLAVINEVRENRQPMVITQDGKASAVIF